MNRFDKAQEKQRLDGGYSEPAPTANGNGQRDASESNGYADSPSASNKRKADSEELSDVEDSPAPKKVKKEKKAETDEEMARRLAVELNAQSARSTRGGGAKRKAPAAKTKKPKKKSSAKVNSDDDSAVESGDKPVKEKKGGFHVSRIGGDVLRSLPTNVFTETHGTFGATRSHAGRNSALTPTNSQANLGLCQSARHARPQRQAPNRVR